MTLESSDLYLLRFHSNCTVHTSAWHNTTYRAERSPICNSRATLLNIGRYRRDAPPGRGTAPGDAASDQERKRKRVTVHISQCIHPRAQNLKGLSRGVSSTTRKALSACSEAVGRRGGWPRGPAARGHRTTDQMQLWRASQADAPPANSNSTTTK